MPDQLHSLTIAGADAVILDPADPFWLSCDPSGCRSNCCTKSAPVVLNPYEISLISAASGIRYEDLLDVFETDRANAFPLVMLPRNPACRFWTGQGCGIYSSRPLACRLYPLGRVFERGRSFLVKPQVNACSGVSVQPTGTVGDYLESQDAALQIALSDRWIEFVSFIEKLPLPDSAVTSVAFHLLVYSPDTPPSPEQIDPAMSLEDRFILRLSTAREQLPRLLSLS